eukprot:Hpha_TRINITY_DN15390_c1_g3::TRINITY_DN15390_c1_g3_i1::g.92075::m.92075
MMIRTSLMRDIDWDLTDSRGYGWAQGNVRFGPGIVFDEAHQSAASNNRVVSSGWATTVGIIGWSIGGGHGPIAPWAGLGVDNILSADIVLADGSLVTASASSNEDLYFALRGGGGSTWGVITSITIRAHNIPAGGFAFSTTWWAGNDSDVQRFYDINAQYVEWSTSLDSSWGGMAYFGTSAGKSGGVEWYLMMHYVYGGSNTSTTFTDKIGEMQSKFSPISVVNLGFETMAAGIAEKALEPIMGAAWAAPSDNSRGGLSSVLVSRDNAVKSADILPRYYEMCKVGICTRMEYYHAMTGNVGSPQPGQVAISPALRSAVYHVVLGALSRDNVTMAFDTFGSSNQYFSESNYNLTDFDHTSVYWGSNTARLQEIKTKYDSENVFTCHNCIQATVPPPPPRANPAPPPPPGANPSPPPPGANPQPPAPCQNGSGPCPDKSCPEKTSPTEGTCSDGTTVPLNGVPTTPNDDGGSSPAVPIVIVLSVLAVAGIGGFFVLRAKGKKPAFKTGAGNTEMTGFS